jgi:4-hydroxybenzoate polyprenyltransferase
MTQYGSLASSSVNDGYMTRVWGFVRASHAAPTAVVTIVVTLLAVSLGWRGWPLAGVFLAVAVGQLSVGWSNDAFDAPLDVKSGRREKPTIAHGINPRQLWIAAGIALAISSAMSWYVAGAVGGSWHVFALAMAWLYNIALSRTWWSWLPYALAFGSIPAFLTFGLDGQAPAWWLTISCAIVGVSAHLANALPDLEMDRRAEVKGFVTSIGFGHASRLCWGLLILGTAILGVESYATSLWFPVVLVLALVSAGVYAKVSNSRTAIFNAILCVVVVQVLVVLAVAAPSL